MNGTKLTFNDTTYEFNYFMGRNKATGKTFDCYGVYVNGEKDTDYVLEEGTETTGDNTPIKIWNLYYKSFYCMVSINDFSLGEIVKVIDYINSKK